MQKKHYLFPIIYCILVTLSSVGAGEEKNETIFGIDQLELKCIEYPWANELCLWVSGRANPCLDKASLSLTIFYRGYIVIWKEFSLARQKDNEDILFAEEWSPINKAIQQILLGKYEVQVVFLLRNQSQKFQENWAFDEKKQDTYIYKKEFELGTVNQIEEEQNKIKGFYLERMKNLNQLFVELNRKSKEALSIPEDIKRGKKNSFLVNREFSSEKWQTWFQNSFIDKVVSEKNIFERHIKSVFYPCYPYTVTNLKEYCDLLDQLGRVYAVKIHKFYNVKEESKDALKIDPFGIGEEDLIQHIRRIHVKASEEMGIDLKKELGYIPPYLPKD